MFRVVELGRMVGIPMVMTSEEVERLDWNLEREKSEPNLRVWDTPHASGSCRHAASSLRVSWEANQGQCHAGTPQSHADSSFFFF